MHYPGNSARDTVENIPLTSFCGTPLEPDRFLQLAVSITEALVALHKRQLVHRNIRPQHIFIDSGSSKALLADPSMYTSLSQHSRDALRKPELDIAIAYMSPEQLGRMNRVVDYRSDLYSLGVTFYEMLTGRPPFQANDMLEWFHCHFARMPKAPIQLIPAISPIVSDIVMKLLAKTVEERYQTALGLKHDLERCRSHYVTGKRIDPFPLAEGDISDQLLIPEKLYGREKDIDLLVSAFGRVQQRGVSEMVMITGYSGIGKTSLVGELFRPVVREHGFFISGKFDQYRRNIPYTTIIEAFQGLIRQILTEHEDRLAQWRKKLNLALGINGQLIVDIIPQVELIIGRQAPVLALPATEAENRFNMIMVRFLGVFSEKSHPLVMFLDDLQWVDLASLKLIEHIITDSDTNHLLLIGAYRDNEVDPTHPLLLSLANICDSKVVFQSITLAPLAFSDLGHLVADTFRCDTAQAEPFIRLIFNKTAGNPFFVVQFLMSLYREHLVEFSMGERCWKWDVEQIQAMGYTDNVVDLMTAKLLKLPTANRECLRLAACIGNKFELSNLAKISGMREETTRGYLEEAIQEVLLVLTEPEAYSFAHDRVQQAAYFLTPEDQRMALHLQIGRLMLAGVAPESLGNKIFEIVNQLNLGAVLINGPEERFNVAELNLMAGKKAKASSAYASALNYFTIGVDFLGDEAWDRHYDLSYGLYKELAEAEYQNSNYTHSKNIIDLLLGKARSELQRAELYNMLIIQYTLMAQYAEALQFGRKALQIFNVRLPDDNFADELGTQLNRYREILGNREISSLINDSEMSDPYTRVSLELLANMLVPARYSDNALFALIAVITVNLSLKFGPTAKSTVGYTAFGMVLQSKMNKYRDGYDFGDLALKISERFNNPAQKCQTCLVLGHYLNHWVRPLKEADNFLNEGFREGLAAGEMQWTGYCLAYKLFQPFYRGVPIPQLAQEIPTLLSFTEKTKNKWATDTLLALQLALSSLDDNDSNAASAQYHFSQEKEDNFLATCKLRKSFGALGRYAVLKVQIHFLFGRIEEARQALFQAQELIGFFSSSISIAELNFYSSLIYAALSTGAPDDTRKDYLQKIEANQHDLRIWAEHCEANFKHQYLLVEAERVRSADRVLDAEHFYEQAIQAAHEYGFVQDEALANELASRFYRQRKLATIADAYLIKSRSCYLRWGANGKVKQLDQLNPRLWLEEEEAAAKVLGVQIENLDAIAVVKASQAISGEIVLSRLVETLMRTVIENAGAQKGALILVRDEDLKIEAMASIINQQIRVSQHAHPHLDSVLPASMLTYVKRTGETVIIDDASDQNMFSQDPYVDATNPMSVLCLPLLRQAQIVGMLYLENNIVKGAFTKKRIAVLELLAAQAAISLENAALYLERSRAELALRESEEKYRSIFEDSGTPLVFIDEDKTVSICNTAFEKLSGYSRSEVENIKKWTDLVARKEDLARMAEYHRLRRINPQAAPQTYEFELVNREGKLKDVVATVTMMRGTKKSLAALLDITERKRAVEALQRSERKFRAIFDSSFQFIGLLNVEGVLLQVNETALEFAGVKESTVVGLPFWETPWVKHSPALQEKMRSAVAEAATGRLVRFEADHLAADGSLHYVDFSLKPVKDEAGNVVLLIPEGRDITERKLAEEEQARLVTAIEQSAEAVFISDIGFVIRYANPALEKMSGFDRKELIGRHIRILASENQDETLHSEMSDTLTKGLVWSGRLFYRKKNGGSYEAEVTASPVRDKVGTIINYVSIHRDITREVQLEKELRQVHKMEAIGTLAGGIAHDFNNILSVIQGHTQLTNLRLPENSPLKNSLSQVLVSCIRAKELVNQILTFSRQTDHEKRPVQLLPLVDEVLQLLRPSLPTTIEIRQDIVVPPEQSVIMADATQIHQVLMNLAANAAHAMGGQGGILGVRVAKEMINRASSPYRADLSPGSYVMLAVSDTGHGMDAAIVERIFDPYFTTKGPGEGSGIGLTVTQGIVKAHNGAIVVNSEPGLGTQFNVYFPEIQGAVVPVLEKKEALRTGNERILFVDDEEPLVAMAKELLEALGYLVTGSTSSQEALEIFLNQPSAFDLVITDMTMPGLTGTEIATKMMSLKPDLPVILCTGFSELVNARQALAMGIRQLIMKPWDVSEMAASIRRVLEQDKL